MLQAINLDLARRGLLMRAGTIVDATLIAAPSSTRNLKGTRDPEMHQTKKGNNYHFGMKAHIGVDAEMGLCIASSTKTRKAKRIASCSIPAVAHQHDAQQTQSHQIGQSKRRCNGSIGINFRPNRKAQSQHTG